MRRSTAQPSSRAASVDRLESRRLLAFTPTEMPDQDVVIDGTDGDDVITLAIDVGVPAIAPPQVTLVVTVNGERRTYTNIQAAIRTITVRGGAGNDSIRVLDDLTTAGMRAGGGASTEPVPVTLVSVLLEGGEGNDFLRAQPRDAFPGHDTGYTLRGDAGNDLLIGSPGADTLDGGGGRDRVFGRGGNDTIVRDAGRSFAAGGASLRLDRRGVLTILGSAAPDAISVHLRDDTSGYGPALEVTLNGHARTFQPDHFRQLPVRRIVALARGGNDVVTLAAELEIPAFVSGGAGDDTLTGGAAGDVLLGGAGNDNLVGSGGPDRLLGGPGEDVTDAGPEDLARP